MKSKDLTQTMAWRHLEQEKSRFRNEAFYLKRLITSPNRLASFSRKVLGFFFDFSRQRIDETVMSLLIELAHERDVMNRFRGMTEGEKVNGSENRAALHTATRDFSGNPIYVDGVDIMPEMRRVRDEIRAFTEGVVEGRIKGSTGKPFSHVVVIGIGGSYLGAEFAATALASYADRKIALHFLANVDFHNFDAIRRVIVPPETLFISISKSNTTAETLANEKQAWEFLAREVHRACSAAKLE